MTMISESLKPGSLHKITQDREKTPLLIVRGDKNSDFGGIQFRLYGLDRHCKSSAADCGFNNPFLPVVKVNSLDPCNALVSRAVAPAPA